MHRPQPKGCMTTIASALPSRNTQQPRFDAIGITSDTLTGRGGLAFFSRYLHNIGIFPHLVRLFGGVRKNSKGHSVVSLFHQLFCCAT